jgi:hypothetical protein
MSGSPQGCDCIFLRANILYLEGVKKGGKSRPLTQYQPGVSNVKAYDDIVHVILLNLGSKVYVYLYPVLGILLFDGLQERVEPFCTAEIADDPGEVHLGEACGFRVVHVVHAVPNRLQNAVIYSQYHAGLPGESVLLTKQTV